MNQSGSPTLRFANIIAALLLVAFLVINIVNLRDYGMSWDEPLVILRGKLADEYFTALIEGTTPTTPIRESAIEYHPTFFALLNHLVAKQARKFTPLDYVSSHHLLVLVAFTLALLSTYVLAKKAFGEWVALSALLFLMLFPHLVAHAHYNPKDVPSVAFSTWSLMLMYLAVCKGQMRYALGAGVAFGMGLTSKLDSLIVLPILFVALGVYLAIRTQQESAVSLRKIAALVLGFGAVSAVTTFVTWPALWTDPLHIVKAIDYFARGLVWPGYVLYLGQVTKGTDLPWHYGPLYLAFVTPLVTLACFAVGLGIGLVSLKRREQVWGYALVLAWFSGPMALQLKPGMVRYDGIRHFFMAVPPLCILAGVGLQWLVRQLQGRLPRWRAWCPSVSLALVGVILFYQVAQVHPHQGSYFNIAVRAMIPAHIEQQLEIEYWGSSYRQGVDWLNAFAAPNAKVCVPIAARLVGFYDLRSDITCQCDPDSDYVMFFPRYTLLEDPHGLVTRTRQEAPVFTISHYNSNLLYIYHLVPSETEQPR